MTSRQLLFVVAAAAALGLVFSSFSTYDFVQHYDRQVHSVHCSFLPGITAPDATGSSGCQVTMLSPYSSVLRTQMWGGVPISLPAMSVFAFLLFLALEMAWSGRGNDRRALGFLCLAAAVPVLASLVMGIIAAASLGTACKLCIGIYVASAAGWVAALLVWRRTQPSSTFVPSPITEPIDFTPAPRAARDEDPAWTDGAGPQDLADVADGDEYPARRRATADTRRSATREAPLGAFFGLGVFFVAAPVAALVVAAPDHDPHLLGCGMLRDANDRYAIMAPLPFAGAAPTVRTRGGAKKARMVEVLDPLCPACRALEQSLERLDRTDELERHAVMFPLDNQCNWMVDRAIHPGACTVSEAVLCAGERAPDVLEWAFAQQDAVREAAANDPGAARRMVLAAFPQLERCVGSPTARSRMNKSLRWVVINRLRVLTPQLFVEGVRVCEEDLDLGLEYTISALLDGHAAGRLPKPPPLPAAQPPDEPAAEGDPAGGTTVAGGGAPAPAPEGGAPAVAAPPPSDTGAEPAADGDAGGSAAALEALERARRAAQTEEAEAPDAAPEPAAEPPAPEPAPDAAAPAAGETP